MTPGSLATHPVAVQAVCGKLPWNGARSSQEPETAASRMNQRWKDSGSNLKATLERILSALWTFSLLRSIYAKYLDSLVHVVIEPPNGMAHPFCVPMPYRGYLLTSTIRLEDVAAQIIVPHNRGDHILHVLIGNEKDFLRAGGSHTLRIRQRRRGFLPDRL